MCPAPRGAGAGLVRNPIQGGQDTVARLGELERAVMDQLWAHPGGMLTHEIAAGLQPTPAATTVLTVLTRLARKGLVTRVREGAAYRHAAVTSKEAFVAELMRTTLNDAGDPEAVLAHFVDTASAPEIAALWRVLGTRKPPDGDDDGQP